jgi:hypothetical protein
MVLPYYDYLSAEGSKKNDPNFVAVDQPGSAPKTFTYTPSGTQGIHPPAPIYQSNQPPQPAASAMYYLPVRRVSVI